MFCFSNPGAKRGGVGGDGSGGGSGGDGMCLLSS